MASPELATDDQRWEIFHLFEHFGIKDIAEVRVTAAQILKLDYLPDLRELAAPEAEELIGELRRAMATKRVGGD